MADSCSSCLYGRKYPEGVRRCCYTPPVYIGAGSGVHAFEKVEDWEWCGEFAPLVPAPSVEITGNVLLTAASTLVKLLDVGGDPVLTVAAMQQCQVTNAGGAQELVLFYDGNSTTTRRTTISVLANQTQPMSYSPAIKAVSGQLWVTLGSSGSVYVAAQGQKVKP